MAFYVLYIHIYMYIMYAYIYMYIYTFICVLLLFSPSVLFDSLWPHWPPGSIHASLSFTVSQSLLTLMSIEFVMPSNHLILCYSYLLLPSVFPSIRIFSSESAVCIRYTKYWSFSFSISPSNEYLGVDFL